jgi:aspartate kinase
VAGIASEKELVLIQSREVNRLLNVIEEFGVSGKQLHVITVGSEQDGVSMVVSKENLHQISHLQAALEVIPARWNDSLGAVSIIGTGITASHRRILEGSYALRKLDVHCAGIATSSFRVTWLIERAKVDLVVQYFHQLFVEDAQPEVP